MNRRQILKTAILTPLLGLFKKKSKLNGWIFVNDRLPDDRTYVLAIHNRGTWKDGDDSVRVNCVVVKFKRGLSKEERLLNGCASYCDADEGFNNAKPYCWSSFGPDCFFGQSITYWRPIDAPPRDT